MTHRDGLWVDEDGFHYWGFLEWGMEHDENTMEVTGEEDGMRGFFAVFCRAQLHRGH
jgi:hypothetical protein